MGGFPVFWEQAVLLALLAGVPVPGSGVAGVFAASGAGAAMVRTVCAGLVRPNVQFGETLRHAAVELALHAHRPPSVQDDLADHRHRPGLYPIDAPELEVAAHHVAEGSLGAQLAGNAGPAHR